MFARHAKALGRRRGASATAPSPSASAEALQLMVEADDVEAFRHDGSVDGAPVQSPEGSLGGGSRGAGAGFGRRSGLSGGSGSLLAQALAAPSPKSGSGRAGRGSDAFGSMRAGDLPGAGGEDFFDAPYPDADADYGAVGLPFGGGDGGVGLSAPFESLLETGPDGTQTQRDPKKALSGVSIGLIKYFTEAIGSTASQEAAITVEDMCASGRCAFIPALRIVLGLTRRSLRFLVLQAEPHTARAALLADSHPGQQRIHQGALAPRWFLGLQHSSLTRALFEQVKQDAPYANIVIRRGTAAMP